MAAPLDRVQARRVFEEVLKDAQAKYLLPEDIIVEALATNEDGRQVVVARYKLYVDGRIECFALLDEVLWPPV